MHLHINVKNIYKFDYLWPDLDFAVYLWKWHAVEQTLPLKFIPICKKMPTKHTKVVITWLIWLDYVFNDYFELFFALVMTLTRV